MCTSVCSNPKCCVSCRFLLASWARKLSSVRGGVHQLEIIRLFRKGLMNLVDTICSTNLHCLANYDVYLCNLLCSHLYNLCCILKGDSYTFVCLSCSFTYLFHKICSQALLIALLLGMCTYFYLGLKLACHIFHHAIYMY